MLMRVTVTAVLAMCIAGCATQAPRLKGPTVGVEHFTIDRPTDQPDRDSKMAELAAEWLVGALRNEGVDAYLVPMGGPPYGDVRITGAITELNYVGRDLFGVLLTIRDSSGRELARVSAARSSYSITKAVRVTMSDDVMRNQEFRHAVFTMPAGMAAKP